MIKSFGLLAIALAVLAGCSSGNTAAATPTTETPATTTTTTTTTTTAEPAATPAPQRFESVYEMRHVFEQGGYECAKWAIRSGGAYADEAANCTDAMIFTIYGNASEAQAHAELRAEITASVGVSRFIIGPNWATQCHPTLAPTCEDLVDLLHGDFIEFDLGA